MITSPELRSIGIPRQAEGKDGIPWMLKVAVELADVGYSWNEVKTLAIYMSDWN